MAAAKARAETIKTRRMATPESVPRHDDAVFTSGLRQSWPATDIPLTRLGLFALALVARLFVGLHPFAILVAHQPDVGRHSAVALGKYIPLGRTRWVGGVRVIQGKGVVLPASASADAVSRAGIINGNCHETFFAR